MVRRYDETVEVRRCDDQPAAFRWRGRRYAVHAVVAHWFEAGAWWRGLTGGSDDPVLVLDDREREVWRVEAATHRSLGRPLTDRATGIYDLCFDWSGGGWTVVRAHD